MSTRGATCLVANGVEKTVYKHHDAYPDGLGEDVLTWLRTALADEDGTRKAVVGLREVPEGDPTPGDMERYAEYRDPHVNGGKGWYSLLRRTQGNTAAMLRAGLYEDAGDFPRDSLFCEWAYVVDFDERRFEVYKGFRQTPPTKGRWVGQSPADDASTGYYPVQRVRAWGFDELPADLAGVESGDEDEL